MVTIKDISKACGVSPATVSKALNGYEDISAETVRLVKQTAAELNYTPNAAARLLKTSTSHNIGVLFVDDTMSGLTHEYFSFILNSVKEEAELNGYDITFISNTVGRKPMSFLQHCLYRNCDGVVIACVNFDSPGVHELVSSKVPVVTIDFAFDNVSAILSDNVEGAYSLASHLMDMGHRRIAFIHGERTSVTNKRIVGFNRALKERGVAISSDYMREARYHDPVSGRKATAELMDLPQPPTAIMFPDDMSFLGGQAELTERGFSIPEDISVCGYDGIHISQMFNPPLTTWHQDAARIGKESVRKLVEAIEHRETCAAEQIKVSGELIYGHSVDRLEQ